MFCLGGVRGCASLSLCLVGDVLAVLRGSGVRCVRGGSLFFLGLGSVHVVCRAGVLVVMGCVSVL